MTKNSTSLNQHEQANQEFDLIADICASGSLEQIMCAFDLPPQTLIKALKYRHSWIFACMISNHNEVGYKYVIENKELLEHINGNRIVDCFCLACLNGYLDTVTYFLDKGLMIEYGDRVNMFVKNHSFQEKMAVEVAIEAYKEKRMIEQEIQKLTSPLDIANDVMNKI